MKLTHVLAVAAFSLATAVHAQAQATTDHAAHHAPAASSATAAMADGEVRKIDREQAKLTLKHGRIENLDMPGMTMVFKVKDAAMLDKVQVGSKVKFKAEKADGAIVVTNVEVAQ